MNRLNRMKSSMGRALVTIGQDRVRRHLLTLDEHMLENLGYSRTLLDQGLGAWPWRINPNETRPDQRHY